MDSSKKNKLFLFGGCYSNLQATQRVQQLAKEMGYTRSQIICTGDIVGYCAQPEETLNLIQNWGIRAIAGNVEIQLRNNELDCGCNFDEGSRCDTFSQQWFPYSRRMLSQNSFKWLDFLPESLQIEQNGKRIHVLHGGTTNTSEFIFESTPKARKLEIFAETSADVIIAGHSGLPFIQQITDELGNDKLWINAGVIGMPANDGTTRCWFATLDTLSWKAGLHSFDYDFSAASALMDQNHLPKEYVKTLRTGIWDNCEILPDVETAKQGVQLVF